MKQNIPHEINWDKLRDSSAERWNVGREEEILMTGETEAIKLNTMISAHANQLDFLE